MQLGHDALRAVCTPVAIDQIQAQATQDIIQDLRDTLAGESDGVGLSAPQIAVTKRIFIVSPLAFTASNKAKPDQPLICINPRITKSSKKTEWMEEGCLSIRWVYGEVSRYRQVTLEYYDETGAKHSRGFSGFLSHVVQHELDHLNGVLFIDHASEVHELTPAEIAKIKQDNNPPYAE